VRKYETFLQARQRALAPEEPGAQTDGRRVARLTDVLIHDGSGYPRAEFASGETVALDVGFATEDSSLSFHVRIGIDREDGVQVFAVDTRQEPWAPLTGRTSYRLSLVLPELPVAQGDFRVYVYLGDEKALHVHDARILKSGFSVAASEYVVGLLRPRHHWMFPARSSEPTSAAASASASAPDRFVASS
jgi:hypothetical protein